MKTVSTGLFLIFMLFCFLLPSVYAGDDEAVLPVLRMDRKSLESWEVHEFEGTTDYQPVTIDGRDAIRAISRGTAAAFYREVAVDLRKYPYLSWSWKVVAAPENPVEKTKGGDDFAARVYVVVKTGLFPWQIIALNYVWSMDEKGPDVWISPYTDRMKMKAVDRGSRDFGRWITHKVNVAEDLKSAFGKDVEKINGVAVMTDMDNTGKTATAYYGEISFSRK